MEQEIEWDEVDLEAEDTPMKTYFRDKNVFITGGTGFLGLLYVEKLLRTNVKCIYLLTRAKKGKSPQERLKNMFSGVVFHKIKKINPNYLDKIRIVEGDLGALDLGISEDVIKDIHDNVHIVLHAAADVRFDEKLTKLLVYNLRGTREVLKLCEGIKKLETIGYISTAYSNCYRLYCEEKFYPSPIDPDVMIKFGEKYFNTPEDELIIKITEKIIRPWPNTYTYTKCLSEELIRRAGDKFKICVIRPSIVISTEDDPVPGWCNNIYGLNGVIVACGLGLLRIMPCADQNVGDVVMADFVSNGTLAAIWHTNEEIDHKKDPVPKIYHISTSADSPVTWRTINESVFHIARSYPSRLSMWYPTNNYTTSTFMWVYCNFVYHVFPAIIFDFFLKLTGGEAKLLAAYRKIVRFMDALRFFMSNQWYFKTGNLSSIIDRMHPYDKAYFPCDVRKYKWDTYSFNYYHGIKRYLGNDDINQTHTYVFKAKVLTVAHTIIKFLYYSFLAYLSFVILRKFGLFRYIADIFDV